MLAIFFTPAVRALDIAFDSTNMSASAGYSSTDLTMIAGDAVHLTKTGLLSEFKFDVYNSSSSTGALISATETISFYDYTGATVGTQLGTFSVSLGALAKGGYQTFSLSSLESQNINLNVSDIFITQQLSNVVGSSRMGVVLSYANNPSVGSNLTNGFYAGSWLVLGGQTYNNLRYEVGVVSVPEPSTYFMAVAGLTCVGMVSKQRRRTS